MLWLCHVEDNDLAMLLLWWRSLWLCHVVDNVMAMCDGVCCGHVADNDMAMLLMW